MASFGPQDAGTTTRFLRCGIRPSNGGGRGVGGGGGEEQQPEMEGEEQQPGVEEEFFSDEGEVKE